MDTAVLSTRPDAGFELIRREERRHDARAGLAGIERFLAPPPQHGPANALNRRVNATAPRPGPVPCVLTRDVERILRERS